MKFFPSQPFNPISPIYSTITVPLTPCGAPILSNSGYICTVFIKKRYFIHNN